MPSRVPRYKRAFTYIFELQVFLAEIVIKIQKLLVSQFLGEIAIGGRADAVPFHVSLEI